MIREKSFDKTLRDVKVRNNNDRTNEKKKEIDTNVLVEGTVEELLMTAGKDGKVLGGFLSVTTV